MATLKDVARLAGVAPSTVSGVLNNTIRVRKDTRSRIMQAVKQLDYRPNQLARSLRVRNTRTIGLIMPSIINPFYPAIARGVEDIASSQGYSVLLSNTDRTPDKEKRYIDTLLSKQVDGLVFAASMTDDATLLDLAERPELAIILMNRPIDHPKIDEVFVDFRRAAYHMTEYLLKCGHRDIAFIAGPRGVRRAEERLAGYQDALLKHGVGFERSLVTFGSFDYGSGYDIGKQLANEVRRFTAIFASNDLMAIGCMTALQDAGIDIPGDVSVVGFDDIDLAFFIRPKLTTVYQPNYEMGATATRLIIERIEGKRAVRTRQELATRLVIRDSSCELEQRTEMIADL